MIYRGYDLVQDPNQKGVFAIYKDGKIVVEQATKAGAYAWIDAEKRKPKRFEVVKTS